MKKIYPFKFLDAYTKDDTGIFFGRDEEINSLYEMVFQTDILLVYGASGTGKTSLIQCGLASKFQSHDWLALPIRRGNNLNESFDKALKEAGGEITNESNNNGADWLSGVMEDNDEQTTTKQLSPLELSFRAIYLQYFRPIYLIFDQFEELYILGNKDEQDEFIKNVQEILKVEQPVKMIFSIREEYLGQLEKFEKAVPQLLRKKLRVEPMNFEKVSQVIKGATQYENSNVRLKSGEEPSIMEGIFDKLKGGEKLLTIELPYLQVFLDKLYMIITKDDERQAEAVFTVEELNKLGDIGDVLREFLEEQVKSISQHLIARDSDATVENIWKILSPFVTLEGTKEPISRKSLQDRLPGINAELIDKTIDAFVNRRILRKSEKEDMYEIAHDSLAKRIAEKRTTEENTLLEIARIIKNQTFLKGEARELFSEKTLNMVEPFLEKLRVQKMIDEDGEDLIEQSRKKIEQDKEEKVAAQQRELEIANERAKEEKELRKAAETAKERAEVSQNKAKKRSRYAAMAAFVAVIIACVAFFFYYEAKESKLAAEESEKKVKKNLEQIKKGQAMSEAKELYFYAESYKNLKQDSLACVSYRKGLKILQGHQLEDHQEKTLFENFEKEINICDSLHY